MLRLSRSGRLKTLAPAARILAALAGSALASLPLPASAQYTTAVHPSTQYETLEGWGTSLCWFAHMVGGAPDAIRNNFADLIYDPAKGLGFNIARYNIGGGENPKYPNFMEIRARIPGYEPVEGEYDWSQDVNQRWFLNAAMQRGADQLEAFSNSPPYWMTNSGSVTGSTNGTSDNLNPNFHKPFAEYLATVVKHFHDSWGITFRDVEPLNEPIASWWTFGGRQEGCHFERSTQNAIIKELGPLLAQNRSLTVVTAADESFLDDALWSFMSYDQTARSMLTKVNSHSYGGSRRTQLGEVTKSAGKSAWLSEHGDGDGTGLTMSEDILADFHSMHPTAWVYWQACDGGGWGMLNYNADDPSSYAYTLNEKYYVMANYSRFIRPGYTLMLTDDGQSLAAYSAATRTLVLVTTNATGSDIPVTYNLTEFNAVIGPALPYRTSATENLVALKSIPVSGRQFRSVARANSVTTYVLSGVTYSPTVSAKVNDNTRGVGANQFNYVGSWQYVGSQTGPYDGDYHWSSTANSSYSIYFTGTQILLYGSVGPDHGIAAMSIDGGPENEVDLYAAKHADGVPFYASPTLPSSAHTIHVRVTGRKAYRATSTIVTADRADVITGQPVLGAGSYQIINRNSGELLDISQSVKTAGGQAIQWPDYAGPSQQWRLSPAGGGYYTLVNVNSGLVLDVASGSTTNGAGLVQSAANHSASQLWKIVPAGGPYYKLVNKGSGLNAEISSASTSDGAGGDQWPDNGGMNQQWMISRFK